MGKGGRSKAKRKSAKEKVKTSGEAVGASESSSESSSATASSSAPVVVTSSSAEEGKKKIIISPADEFDEDELSLSRTNRPLLVLLFLTPPSIFLVFWTLGSLEII